MDKKVTLGTAQGMIIQVTSKYFPRTSHLLWNTFQMHDNMGFFLLLTTSAHLYDLQKNLTLVQRRAVSPQIFSTSSWRLFKLIYKRFVSDLPVWSKLQKQTMMLNFLHAITVSLFNYFNYQCKVISSNYPHIFKQLIEISLKNNKVTIPNLWMAPGSITIIKIVNIWPHKQNYLVFNWV